MSTSRECFRRSSGTSRAFTAARGLSHSSITRTSAPGPLLPPSWGVPWFSWEASVGDRAGPTDLVKTLMLLNPRVSRREMARRLRATAKFPRASPSRIIRCTTARLVQSHHLPSAAGGVSCPPLRISAAVGRSFLKHVRAASDRCCLVPQPTQNPLTGGTRNFNNPAIGPL